MSEIDSKEDEASDIEEYVTLAYKTFTGNTDELASSGNSVLSLSMSAPINKEGDNISPKSCVVKDVR